MNSSHGYEPPATHVPEAPPAPQPSQVWPTSSRFSPQVSPPEPHAPAAVWQPSVSLHAAVQHSFRVPTPHVVVVALHVQALHTSAVPLQYRVHVAG